MYSMKQEPYQSNQHQEVLSSPFFFLISIKSSLIHAAKLYLSCRADFCAAQVQAERMAGAILPV